MTDSRTVSTAAPAKINLWLEVIRKREDGYHDLSSLMLPLDFADEVEVAVGGAPGVTLESTGLEVPAGSGNLATRAAKAYLGATGWETGVHLRLRKRIPLAAGMGGGSSDAGAVLRLLNGMSPRPLAEDAMIEVARSLGADIPFFLYGRPALAEGIGERLTFVTGVPEYHLVLVKPPLAVSTAWVYSSLKLTRGSGRITLDKLLRDPWSVSEVLENDLESVTLPEYPLLADVKRWLLTEGALGALMSGSGPTVFAVFKDAQAARRVAERAREAWESCWVIATQTRSFVADS